MGKLYYITGNDQQMREKVYSAILQWSQDQQTTPLQPWPATPNFYLYDYLGHGTQNELAQLTELYGENTIEPIYLQSDAEDETETALLEAGIYQSYDPQTDFQSCMQELVETVFTGYQKISYDFTIEEKALQSEKDPKRKKNWRRGLLLIGGVLVLCLVTTLISTMTTRNQKQDGNQIHITPAPSEVTTTTPEPTPMPTLPMSSSSASAIGETRFSEPAAGMDWINDVKMEGQTTTCVSYSNGITCYIPGVLVESQTSWDRQVAALLTEEGNLWWIDSYGIKELAQNVFLFALSRDGNYVYFVSNRILYCYDKRSDTRQRMTSLTTNLNSMAVSYDGGYCAYAYPNRKAAVIERESGTVTNLDTKLMTLGAVSTDGQWIYGQSPNDFSYIRVNTKDSSFIQLTPPNGGGKFYFNKDATQLYYEDDYILYFCDESGTCSKLLEENEENQWFYFLSHEYKDTDLLFNFYHGSLQNAFLCVGNNVYTLKNTGTDGAYLETVQENALWMSYNCFIFKEETDYIAYCADSANWWEYKKLPIETTEHLFLDYSSYGMLFYVNESAEVCGYSIEDGSTYLIADFYNVLDWTLASDGSVLYYIEDNILKGFSVWEKRSIDLYDFSPFNDEFGKANIEWECNGFGEVYLKAYTATDSAIYRLQLHTINPKLIYLGNCN